MVGSFLQKGVLSRGIDTFCKVYAIFGSIVCYLAKPYEQQNFLKIIVHVIIINQWVQVTVIDSHWDVRVLCKEGYL